MSPTLKKLEGTASQVGLSHGNHLTFFQDVHELICSVSFQSRVLRSLTCTAPLLSELRRLPPVSLKLQFV